MPLLRSKIAALRFQSYSRTCDSKLDLRKQEGQRTARVRDGWIIHIGMVLEVSPGCVLYFYTMSITAIVENDTIKLPMHVPDGTKVEITLPGERTVADFDEWLTTSTGLAKGRFTTDERMRETRWDEGWVDYPHRHGA